MSAPTHRLAAILAADIVGYSRMVAADEAGTLAAMHAHRSEVWDPVTEAHGGRLVGTAGDSRLVEFPSAVAAVECAVAIQRAMVERNADVPEAARIRLRIGVNLGDVAVDGDDILGDGVNIAARLEGEAAPDGVCVSDDVMRQVRGRLDLVFRDGGESELKNIAEAVRVWHWPAEPVEPVGETQLALPDKPSIAVLPFDNMSGDPEQEYFADGIAEDVITALSRFRSLFVVARNSSFTYKGQAGDIAGIGRDLGVQYVVEGSVRKAGDRVRITAQLIDAASGNHLWADRFDGTLDDVFDLQDRITEQIVVAVEPEIGAHERERAERKRPDTLDAWELMQRGLSLWYRTNAIDRAPSIKFFEDAIALDPDFAAAHAHLSYSLWTLSQYDQAEDATTTAARAKALAERAVSLDPHDPVAHFVLGRIHITEGDFETAFEDMRTAISVNPNSAWGHFGMGLAYHIGARRAERALPHFDTALRLSPRDPLRWRPLMVKGTALRMLGRQDEAIAYCRRACRIPGGGFLPQLHLAAALANVGRLSEAEAAVDRATALQPALSIEFCRRRSILWNSLDKLREAGLPEQ